MNPALGPMPEFGPMGPPFNSLVHRDDDTGVQSGYYVGEDSAPEEPVFVPKPRRRTRARASCSPWSGAGR